MSGAGAMRKRKRALDPIAEQLGVFFSKPCTLFWSDGSQSETTLAQAFTGEADYKRYEKYKRDGKAYPVKVEAVEPKDPDAPSTVFPQGTEGEDYGLLCKMCEDFTFSLKAFLGIE